VTMCRAGRVVDSLAKLVRLDLDGPRDVSCVCYGKRPVSTISRAYLRITGGSVAQQKYKNSLFFSILRRLEYASSNQGVGGSNPSGRTFQSRT